MDGNNNKRGFGGLSCLVSEINNVDEPIKPEQKVEAKPSTPKQSLSAVASESGRNTTSSPLPTEIVDFGENGDSAAGGAALYVIGIVGMLFVTWLITSIGQDNNTKVLYTPTSSSQSYDSPKNDPAPAVQTPSPNQNTGLQYAKPSAGTDNVLSIRQIRWCIREGIRIEAIRGVIDSNTEIGEFNRIVNDYNNRCGEYKYRRGSQAQAERDVDPYRGQIAAEANLEAKEWGTRLSVSSNKPASKTIKKPSAQYTREAQQLLTSLGYKPGKIDGDYGRWTAAAVKAFQRDVGIAQDGWVDQELLNMLKEYSKQTIEASPVSLDPPTISPPKKPKTKYNSEARRQSRTVNKSIRHDEPTNIQSNEGDFDLSGLPSSDRNGIINTCQYRGSPADVYNCQKKEFSKLQQTGSGPNLSGLSSADRNGIINTCQYRGSPADVYNCQKGELRKLQASRY